MKLYVKKYIPIYIAGDKICIGYASDPDAYIEINNNHVNINLLDKLMHFGIDSEKITDDMYQKMKHCNFLSHDDCKDSTMINRGELYLEYLLNTKVDEHYKTNKILIFGAGAGGSTLIYLLAQFGFSNITIVDFDVVSKSDIHRIMTFNKSDIGKQKTEVLKEKIKSNFDITIQTIQDNPITIEQLKTIIDNHTPDIIVKACDPDPVFKVNLNSICFEKQIPYILMAYSYKYIKIGPTYIPGITSCDASFEAKQIAFFGKHYASELTKRMYDNILVHPSISFNINILSSIVFKEILFLFLGKYEYCQTIGRQVIFNPLTYTFDLSIAKCETTCEICNSTEILEPQT